VQNPNYTRDATVCPQKPGLDADFRMMPTFILSSTSTPHSQNTVVLGQKNGNLYVLSTQAGTLFWATSTGPDGNVGGLVWGVAAGVHYATINSNLDAWTIRASNQTITNSAFSAIGLASGAILWEAPSPGGLISAAPPTIVNDAVFFSRTGNGTELETLYDKTPGGLILVDKASGAILMDYDLLSNMYGGMTVVEGWVMFGTGYSDKSGMGNFNVREKL
jgi:hypothetical protein